MLPDGIEPSQFLIERVARRDCRKALTMQAADQGFSLNRLASVKLAT